MAVYKRREGKHHMKEERHERHNWGSNGKESSMEKDKMRERNDRTDMGGREDKDGVSFHSSKMAPRMQKAFMKD